MKKQLIILLSFILITVPFLHGCAHLLDFLPIELPEMQFDPTPPPVVEPEPEPEEEPVEEVPPPPPRPGRFTLRFDPNSTLNPILTLNRDNIVVSSLIYESLFILDHNLNAIPILSQSWETEDYQEFVFEILPNIVMHDGSILTSADVVYSFRLAMTRGRFANRFNSVISLSVIDELSFSVLLNSPNARFIYLLDFPIIKSDTSDTEEYEIPPGTGPFTISANLFQPRLNRFAMHRNAENMPIPEIHLRTITDSELTDFFDSGGLSLLWDDPASTFDLRLNRHHETRFFETTALQFIGFNANTSFFRDADIRRAVSASIERQLIVDEIMPGQFLAAPLAFSPAVPWYNFDWEFSHLTPAQEMSYLFNRAGLEDFNNTSFLELSTGMGDYIRFTIDFIVNSDNTHKVQAAHRIARTLRQAGADITVRELPWDQFVDALQTGDFDMYYGEIMLGGDFNLSPLLLPGPLNFGGTASTIYIPLIEAFLAASTPEDLEQAASLLLDEIRINAPFAPILYKRHAIYTPLGAISGAQPNQSAIFHNFIEWTIDLYMLT
jgi:peptide/nickel transport system substrate-binding protein